jgi:hypothetical protein
MSTTTTGKIADFMAHAAGEIARLEFENAALRSELEQATRRSVLFPPAPSPEPVGADA